MKHNWQQAFEQMLASEGGFSDDERDNGNKLPDGRKGSTMLGVTQYNWEQHVGHQVTHDDMRKLTAVDVEPLYKKKYWDVVQGDKLPNGIDYATAVITKCLMPNGKINFEFERFSEMDGDQARQATEMVKYMLNSKNDSYQVIRDWAQDSLLHKNGIVMISPVRNPITQYKEVTGTRDQLRVFETLAGDKGLTAKRQDMRKIDVDLQGAMQEAMAGDESMQEPNGDELQDALRNNTIYRAKYKLTGYETSIRVKHVAQHYFVCNPTISTIQDQDFVGFYDPMTIHECKTQFPFVDLELLADHAAYGPAGAYQAGALENDLALHARDSTPVPGQGVIASQGADRYSRVIMLTTAWIRRDIDGDGEEEIVECCFSGSYILYAKEVDFIPLANMWKTNHWV